MIPVSEQILDFLTGIHGDRNNETSREAEIFERAFSLAYKDMSTHTVAYTPAAQPFVNGDSQRCTDNKAAIKEALRDYVKKDFYTENDRILLQNITTADAFAKWHREACDHLVQIAGNCTVPALLDKNKDPSGPLLYDTLVRHKDDSVTTTFTYGQAQKLVNMMLKYLYIYYKCEGRSDLDAVVAFFHVPIDRFVLKEALEQESYKGVPWSRLKTYDEYTACQNEIAASPKAAEYPTAFFWELAKWPF